MRRALLFLIIVLVLGCLKSAEVAEVEVSSDGVKVLSFTVDKNPVQEGESIGFFLQVQNVGEMPATDTDFCIKRSGKFTLEPTGECVDGNPSATLNAPDARVGMPGQTYEHYWSATAPETQFPIKQPITAQISYDYTTVATKEIPILTKKRMDELTQSTAELYKGTTTLTKSPIDIKIQAKDPIQVQGETKTFPFDIVLTNIGQGYVKAEYEDTDADKRPNVPGWCTENLNCIDALKVEVLKTPDKYQGIACENSEGVFTLNIDTEVHTSSGSGGYEGTFTTYSLTTKDATQLKISYDYFYHAESGGHREDAHIITYLNDQRVEDFAFNEPFDKKARKGIWSTTPHTISLDLEESSNTVRLDYINGDYRVKIKNIEITPLDENGQEVYGYGDTVELSGIHLWQGKDSRVKCEMDVVLGDDSERYPVITATADYKYNIETTLEMEALP